MKPTNQPFEPEDLLLSQKLGSSISILRVMVVSSSYERMQIIDQIPGMQMKIDQKYRTTAYVDDTSKQSWTHVDFNVTSTSMDREHEGETCFSIDVRVEVRYLANESVFKGEKLHKAVNAFCHTSGVLHAWSFIRQHIHDAMSRMLLPPIELPLLPISSILPQPNTSTTAKKKLTTKSKH